MTAFKLSRYSIGLPIDEEVDDFVAVYNTLTKASVLLPADQWDRIQAASADIGADIIGALMDEAILVPLEVDETIVFNQWKDRLVHDFSNFRSKVLVTRQCNLRCTYCIIDKEAKVMSGRTAEEMDRFYLDRIRAHKPDQVRDDYLGGEPLLNMNVIVESATRRAHYCRGMGIDYGFAITTNGVLVKNERIDKLIRAGLTAIRVSMAGPEPIHDLLRPSTGGSGTYEQILNNLEQISGSVPIHIECQYDAGSGDYQRIPEMLADLKTRGIAVEDVTFTPILARRGSSPYCAGMGDVDKYLFLSDAAAQCGMATSAEPPTNLCMTDLRSSWVFDTDGGLLPCPALQGGERVYGDVTKGVDFVAESQMLARRLPSRCLERCELLPCCMGGCRLQALIRHEDFNGVDCHYDTYRKLLEIYVRRQAASALPPNAKAA